MVTIHHFSAISRAPWCLWTSARLVLLILREETAVKYAHYDLGRQPAGRIVEVSLSGNAANVRLLDSSNFNAFRQGRQHHYHGGHATRSPVRLQVPRDGHWFILVDLGGLPGRVNSSVRMLPGRLAPSPSIMDSVAEIGDNLAEFQGANAHQAFDVFISHASEDKDGFVRDLAQALAERELTVWYDEFELRVGDSLRRKIDTGLTNSRFGVVVLSSHFFDKNWAQYELDGLVVREMTGQQIVLPIWHNITKDEIIRRSPSLADKVALSTATMTVAEIADELHSVIRPPRAA